MQDPSNGWNDRYLASEHLWIQDPDPTLVEATAKLNPATALDIGAGEGRNSIHLARNHWSVTSVDLSSVALGRLEQNAERLGLKIDTFCGSLAEFSKSAGQFDLIVIANIHPSLSERKELYALAKNLMAEGGTLFLIGHHKNSFGIAGPPDPDRLLGESEVTEAFSDMEIERLEEISDICDAAHDPAPSLVAVIKKPLS